MSTPPFVPERVSTGVPGLDEVLGGGLVKAGLYLIQGRTGAGKTLLAAQIASHRARLGHRVLFVTLLAEFHGKLIDHLRTMEFFDEASFFGETLLLNGHETLTSGGTAMLLQFLASAAREHRPTLLVLDGFGTVREHAPAPIAVSQFVHQLDTLVCTMGCTTLLLSPGSGCDAHPELALVDGLIELDAHFKGMRRGRTLEVHKLRASRHLSGKHTFTIRAGGVKVYPRLEAVMTARDVTIPASSARVEIGVDGLDDMVGGGLIQGTSTRVLGAPGVGKTLLCLQFLATGARVNQKGLYFGVSALVENLIVLNYTEIGTELRRLVTVMKLRESDFDPGIREFIISNHGLRVGGKFPGVEHAMTGQPTITGRGSRPRRGHRGKGRPSRGR